MSGTWLNGFARTWYRHRAVVVRHENSYVCVMKARDIHGPGRYSSSSSLGCNSCHLQGLPEDAVHREGRRPRLCESIGVVLCY